MKLSRLLCIASFIILANACDDGSGTTELTPCTDQTSCRADQVCLNNFCISRCNEMSCKAGELCSVDGYCVSKGHQGDACSESMPCDENLVCTEGKCAAETDPRCDETHPCTGNLVCVAGACIEPAAEGAACSDTMPCAADLTCTGGKCVKDGDAKCDETHPCTGNLVCIAGTCIAPAAEGSACSDAIPCANGLTCTDSVCTKQPVFVPCDNDHPCDDDHICANSLCIPKCTESSCTGGQVCNSDGLCVNGRGLNELCDSSLPCISSLICTGGRCKSRPCSDENPCADGLVCSDKGTCIPKCSKETNPCKRPNDVCTPEGLCIQRCYSGYCKENGTVCGKDGLCIKGECSWYDDCPDRGDVCDIDAYKCVKKCSKGSCKDGTVCGPDHLCIKGECSETDPCRDNSKVCDIDTNTCIPKCTDNASCGKSDLYCYADGLCRKACKTGSCPEGSVCGPDHICVPGDCSDLDPCMASYQICTDDHRCVDKCKTQEDCADNQYCERISGACRTRCTKDSCGEGQVCGDDGACVTGTCSKLSPCPDGKICNFVNQCVVEQFDSNECYFRSDCTDQCRCEENCAGEKDEIAKKNCLDNCNKNCTECQASNKLCPEGKQCTAFNKCIDSASAGGKGLGAPCSENSQCASDLACIIKKGKKTGICRQAAFKDDAQTCNVNSFTDHCSGNIIVECLDGRITVQDCKTYYVNYEQTTTGNFYGDDFSCVQRPDSNYVTCAKVCTPDQVGKTYSVCGWDPNYQDVDYSDEYTCQINDTGRAAYFPSGSSLCKSTCDINTGLCE